MAEEAVVEGQTAEPAVEGVAPQPTETGEQQAAPTVTLEQLHQTMENMGREMGQFRRAQSMLDQLPKTIDDRLTKWQEAQRRNSLPLDQQEAEKAQEAQERALSEFTRKQAIEAIREQFGPQITALESLQKKESQQAYYQDFFELAGGEESGKALEAVGIQLFNEKSKQLDSNNPIEVEQAIKWIRRAEKNPEFLVLEAQRTASKQQQANANNVVTNRTQDGKFASQQPKGSKPGLNQGRKNMGQMNTGELEALMTQHGPEKYAQMLKADMAAAGK
jgi:hypothetical protein